MGEAQVLVRVEISANGDLDSAVVYRGSGNPAMDEEALRAARASTYSPRLVDCRPVAAAYLFKADFRPDATPSRGSLPGSTAPVYPAKNLDDSIAFAAATDDRPRDGFWGNPFCSMAVTIVPWDSNAQRFSTGDATDAFAVRVWAHAKQSYSGRIVLIAGGAAYDIDVPVTQVPPGGSPTSASPAGTYVVMLPHRTIGEVYFVGTAGMDGAAAADCPSFVKPMRTNAQLAAPLQFDPSAEAALARAPRRAAVFDQMMNTTGCSKAYTAMSEIRGYSPLVGHFGDNRKTADVQVFVDSNGSVASTRIARSSGVEGLDDAARSAAQYSQYKPATFLCTPVVSAGLMRVGYDP